MMLKSPTAQRAETKQWTRIPIILIADDDDAVLELLRLHIEQEGYRTVTARDGIEALEKIRVEKPDVIILDIHMPMLDGWGVLEAIRKDERTADIPVVLLTIERSPPSIARGWMEGADCFISKPFDPIDLVTIVRRILATKYEQSGGVEANA